MIHAANQAAAKLREKPSGQRLLLKMGIAFQRRLDITNTIRRISVLGGMMYDSDNEMITPNYRYVLSKRSSRSSNEAEFMLQGM